MKFLSVCSGIEAASVAWQPLGWSAVAFSEIEPAPCAVLAHHYPGTPNWGDMTKYKEWPDVAIDLLCGGTPCQSFSVAGLRKGLDDPRGNLMLTFGAIAAKYRPKWLVWENVPGVLSSKGGADFGAFLGMLGELGYGFAYRVLDAEYFGVAQRRRRVFVVGCLGDWQSAAAVLFERHSLSGHPAPRRQAGERPTGTLSARTKGGGGLGTDFDCSGGLVSSETADTLVKSANQTTGFYSPEIVATLCVATGQAGAEIGADMAPTLNCNHEAPWIAAAQPFSNRGVAADVPAIAFLGETNDSPQETDAVALLRRVRKAIGAQAFAQWGLGILDSLQQAEILRSALHGSEFRPAAFSRRWVVCCALGSPFSRAAGAMHSMREAAGEGCSSQGWGFSEQQFDELGAYLSELPQPGAQAERLMRDLWQAAEGPGLLRNALSAVQEARRPAGREGQPVHAAAKGLGSEPAESVQGAGMHGEVPRERVLQQTRAAGQPGNAGTTGGDEARSSHQGVGNPTLQVRRLVVEECEFLQGFPRGYTAVPHRGKPLADGPKYRALGNSWAVPVARWVGERIQAVQEITEHQKVAA